MKKTLLTKFDVMIIAQSVATIAATRHLLRHSGAATHAVGNGFDAIMCSNLQQFDLVLCDCDLVNPMLSEALVSMRADARHAGVPIIGMTARLSGIGAVFAPARLSGWLSVPLDETEFAAMLAKWQPRAAIPGPVPAQGPDSAHAIAQPGLAVSQALARLRGNVGLYRTMLRRFIDVYPATTALFRRAAATSDHGLASHAVHDLFALAGTIGATALVATLVSLSLAIASGGRVTFKVELATMVDQLRVTLAEALSYLETTAP